MEYKWTRRSFWRLKANGAIVIDLDAEYEGNVVSQPPVTVLFDPSLGFSLRRFDEEVLITPTVTIVDIPSALLKHLYDNYMVQ